MTSARAAAPLAPAAPAHPGRQRVAGANPRELTVIGPALHRAARLEVSCRGLGLELVRFDGRARPRDAAGYRLPGIGRPVEAVTALERA
jgi:hypothetical protein